MAVEDAEAPRATVLTVTARPVSRAFTSTDVEPETRLIRLGPFSDTEKKIASGWGAEEGKSELQAENEGYGDAKVSPFLLRTNSVKY